MNNTKSYFDSINDSLTKVLIAKSRFDNSKIKHFERGEEIIIDRILNKQIPELLKKLIQTIDVNSELDEKLNAVNAHSYASIIKESITEHPGLWEKAFDECKKVTVVTIVIRSLEKAAAEITRVVGKILSE